MKKPLYEAIAVRGDLPAARALWGKLAPLMRLEFSTYQSHGEDAYWFSVIKAGLNMIGPPVRDPEPPVLPLPPQYRRTLAAMLRRFGYRVKSPC